MVSLLLSMSFMDDQFSATYPLPLLNSLHSTAEMVGLDFKF